MVNNDYTQSIHAHCTHKFILIDDEFIFLFYKHRIEA